MKAVQMLMMNRLGSIAMNGYLYNQYATVGLAPTNWAVPSSDDIQDLIDYCGTIADFFTSSLPLKETGTTHWTTNVGATNSTGFTALGSGYRSDDGTFTGLLSEFRAWSLYDGIGDNLLWINSFDDVAANYSGIAKDGNSIRMVYTGAGTPPSIIYDYDGNPYDVVQIGTQYWTVQNWKCTRLNNGTAIPNVTDATTWAGLTTGARCAYDNDENYV